MAWVRFLADWDYSLPHSTIAYKEGMVLNVSRNCAAKALAAGKVVRMSKASKDEAPVECLSDPEAGASTQK